MMRASVGVYKSIAFLALVPIGTAFIGAQQVMGPAALGFDPWERKIHNEQVQGASPGFS